MKSLIIFFALLFSTSNFAKDRSIRFIASDPFLEIFLDDVYIYNELNEMLGKTNLKGEFELENIEAGTKIRFSKENYLDTFVQITKKSNYYPVDLSLNVAQKKLFLQKEKTNESTSLNTITPEIPDSIAYYITKDNSALMKYINENIQYPDYAITNGIQEKIYVRFIVETDGTISSITIVKGDSKCLKKEAARIIKSLPKWTPAYNEGIPIKSYYLLPMVFKLE